MSATLRNVRVTDPVANGDEHYGEPPENKQSISILLGSSNLARMFVALGDGFDSLTLRRVALISLKTAMKRSLIVIALTVVAFLAWIVWRGSRPTERDEPVDESISDTSRGPAFNVRVVVPRSGLPLGGILPDWLVKKIDGTPRELRFDSMSPGARIGSVEHDRVELSSDGWELFIETDGEGRISPATHLVFPTGLGGRQVRLNCGSADRATGYLRTTTRAGSDELGGRFFIELTTCKNAESGKYINWPPAPLTVRGSFVATLHSRR